MSDRNSKRHFKFGTLEFSVTGFGMPIMSDKLKQRIAALPVDEAKAVNRSAWKQRRESTRVANRHCNFSSSGNISIYDEHFSRAIWAEMVCKETYKRMMVEEA